MSWSLCYLALRCLVQLVLLRPQVAGGVTLDSDEPASRVSSVSEWVANGAWRASFGPLKGDLRREARVTESPFGPLFKARFDV